jgi:hypothetical protein
VRDNVKTLTPANYPGPAFKEIKDTKLYPSVGMKKMGTQVRLNFGQYPFMFDIDGMMAVSKLVIYRTDLIQRSKSG